MFTSRTVLAFRSRTVPGTILERVYTTNSVTVPACTRGSGFQHEVNKQLMRAAKLEELDDLQKHVVLVFDEMKIKEDLVFNKHSGEVIWLCQHGRYKQSVISTRRGLQI